MSVNKAILVGNVGNEPEIINLENGVKLAKFRLATSEQYKDKNGVKQEVTDWHNVVIFGKLAEIVEMFVKKGSLLYLEGKNKTHSWEDKEGNKRYTTEVELRDFKGTLRMLGGKSNNEQSPEDDLPY